MVVAAVIQSLPTSTVYNSVLDQKHSNIQENCDMKYWDEFNTFIVISSSVSLAKGSLIVPNSLNVAGNLILMRSNFGVLFC